MAGSLLTAASTLLCPHGGQVTITPSGTPPNVGGSPLVTSADTALVSGCAFMLGTVPSPCVRVQWVTASTHVTAGGAPALDAGSVGLCLAATGAPQGPVSVVQTQSQATGQ